MKKLCFLLVLLTVFLLSSCNQNETETEISDDPTPSENLLELVSSYREKLNTIIDEDMSSNGLLSSYKLDFDENDPYFMTREAFLATYNNQRDNAQDVELSPHLMIYKDLLDDVLEELEKQNIEAIEAQLYVDFRDFMELDAYVSITNDQGILVKLNISYLGYDIYYGIKFGYENEDFFLRELSMGMEAGRFEYFEFLENHQMIDIRYADYTYWYRYQNQNDNTYYEISKSKYELFDDYVLSWFNPETNIRTRIIRTGEGHMNHFELFNYQGISFSFTDYIDSDRVDVAWQLLEATGWDSVYYEENTSNPLNGIYKDGEKIFTGARMNIDLTDMFANVRIEYTFNKLELTNDILNLSAYGLDFNYDEINLDYIESVISTSLEESSHLSVYRGIDFINDDLSQTLYEAIDPDIKP